eukprot:1134371-Pelagomonas_calceolata.AAC.8
MAGGAVRLPSMGTWAGKVATIFLSGRGHVGTVVCRVMGSGTPDFRLISLEVAVNEGSCFSFVASGRAGGMRKRKTPNP